MHERATRLARRPINVACLTELSMGHSVFIQNLRTHLQGYDDLRTEWVDIDFARRGLLSRLTWLDRHPALWGSLRAMQALPGLLRRPDVLLFHTQTIAQLALPLMPFIPTLITLDATQRQFARLAAYDGRKPGSSAADRLIDRSNGIVFRAARALLPMSSWAARSLRDDYHVDPSRIVVNPPGVDRPAPAGPRRRGQDEPVRVLFVGSDFERKGGPLLLAALRKISRPWELHLVTRERGGGGDHVYVHGAVANRSAEFDALLASSDIFALPTLGDCFSIASLDAMAAGLPVITTTVGGIPDIVVEGETGYLVPPGDGAILRQRLEMLMADGNLRRRMGEAGRQRAAEHFDAGKRAATVRHVIRAISLRSSASGGRSSRLLPDAQPPARKARAARSTATGSSRRTIAGA